ncbi:MAG: lantibiotic immunity ABC transporter MutG family permease subunit [Erysipelotrichaceae bacterium]|nr:lantibiotic immunity ABC transporter MutG family permease subunit [Erysipelotrichaceae bacterium]MDY5252637.1 lantibiotic immunity ABC transporter MutG family permease subunit [Erysipelotrichaceae bacterium]
MGRCFKAELYKFVHTPLLIIHVLVSLLCPMIFVGYYQFANIDELNKLFIYEQIIAVSFPMMIAIICYMAAKLEKEANNAQLMLIYPAHQLAVHLSKLMVMMMFGMLACLTTFGLFGLGLAFMGHNNYAAMFYIKSALSLFYATIPLYIFNYLLAMKANNSVNLTFGLFGSLLAALLTTGLGDRNWFLLLHGIIARGVTNMLINSSNEVYNIKVMILIYMIIAFITACICLYHFEGFKDSD